jgi:hypothetical protein
MSESEQLLEDCRKLRDYSRLLRDYSRLLHEHSASVHVALAQLDQRCRLARAEARRLQRLIPTYWLPPQLQEASD